MTTARRSDLCVRQGAAGFIPTPRAQVCFIAIAQWSPFDVRIWHREARTLARAGYQVSYIVQHPSTQLLDDIRIIGLPAPRNRLLRMTWLTWRAFRLALRTEADVFHFHSPEFLPMGLLLRLLGKRVIYDAHEAFRDKLLIRSYLPRWLRPVVSRLVAWLERTATRWFDHTIVADRYVAQQFNGRPVTVLANFPLLAMVRAANAMPVSVPANPGRTIAIYVGELSRERGLFAMAEAMDLLGDADIELRLLGQWVRPETDQASVTAVRGVRYLGFRPLQEVFAQLRAAHVGLVVLQPVPAYSSAGENTNKLFEYMAFGLAVIASDFPNLRPFIDRIGCGICVDPRSPRAIAEALRRLHDDRQLRIAMGARGRAAVETTYNWESESQKLLGLYDRILGSEQATRSVAHDLVGPSAS